MTFDVAKLAGTGIGAGRVGIDARTDGVTGTGGGTESPLRGSVFSIFAIAASALLRARKKWTRACPA